MAWARVLRLRQRRETIPLSDAPSQGPQTILVQPFEFEDDMIRVNREGAELEAFKRALQQEMTANLYERIRKYIAPSQVLYASPPEPLADLRPLHAGQSRQSPLAHHSRLWIGRDKDGRHSECLQISLNLLLSDFC